MWASMVDIRQFTVTENGSWENIPFPTLWAFALHYGRTQTLLFHTYSINLPKFTQNPGDASDNSHPGF